MPRPPFTPPDPSRASITTKDGFLHFVDEQPPVEPARLTTAEILALSPAGKRTYDRAREDWHSNLGPYGTPLLEDVWDELDSSVRINRQRSFQTRPGVFVNGPGGNGKTTSVLTWARRFHRATVTEDGHMASQHFQRLPVCFVSLEESLTTIGLDGALCQFYGLPNSGRKPELSQRVMAAVANHDTRVIAIDDVHFVNLRTVNGKNLSNHFKYLMTVTGCTVILTGIDMGNTGLIPSLASNDQGAAQTLRRFVEVPVAPYRRRHPDWRRILKAFEADVRLGEPTPGLLFDTLNDYLYDRTQGSISSLKLLLMKAADRAVVTGEEKLSYELINRTRNDIEGERRRTDLPSAGGSPPPGAAA